MRYNKPEKVDNSMLSKPSAKFSPFMAGAIGFTNEL